MKSNPSRNDIEIGKTEILEAYEKVRQYLDPTPIIKSQYLSHKFGTNVFLKLESMQPTHSFKVRGAINCISSLEPEKISKGIVTASGGNHGLGVAYACRLLNTKAIVFLPVKTPEIKVKALENMGATIELYGEAWDEANLKALEYAEDNQLSYVHPFNNRYVIAGQGSIVSEILQANIQPDLIVASIGGGGLISGISMAVKHLTPHTKVVGVETIGADCMSKSIKANEIIELKEISSIADSLGAKKTESTNFEIIRKHVDQIAVVSDKETVEASLALLESDKVLAEPAASCCIAALENGSIPSKECENIVVIICGANISLSKLLGFNKSI